MRKLQRRTSQFPLLLGKFFILFYAGVYALAPLFMLRAGFMDRLLPVEAALSIPVSAVLIGWSIWNIKEIASY